MFSCRPLPQPCSQALATDGKGPEQSFQPHKHTLSRPQGSKHKVLKIFRDMPDRNVSSLVVVYQKAAELFTKLEALLPRYKPYVSLGMYPGNLDDLVEENMKEAAMYEASFKALKARRKEAEKLPAFEKVAPVPRRPLLLAFDACGVEARREPSLPDRLELAVLVRSGGLHHRLPRRIQSHH